MSQQPVMTLAQALALADTVTPAPAAAHEALSVLRAEFIKFREFARDCVEDIADGGDLDGPSLRAFAVKNGLLLPVMMPAPCGETCACLEYFSEDEFPVECLHRTALLTGKPEDPRETSEA